MLDLPTATKEMSSFLGVEALKIGKKGHSYFMLGLHTRKVMHTSHDREPREAGIFVFALLFLPHFSYVQKASLFYVKTELCSSIVRAFGRLCLLSLGVSSQRRSCTSWASHYFFFSSIFSPLRF